MWLTRSGGHSLAINVRLTREHREERRNALTEILVLHHRRWRDFQFYGWSGQSSQLYRMTGPFPNLWSIDLGLSNKASHDLVVEPLSIFKDAPRLTEVRLRCWMTPILPWSQFQSLILDDCSVADCLWALEHCPNLVKFGASVFKDTAEDDGRPLQTTISPHSLLQLHRLDVCSIDLRVSKILNHITAPAVHSMRIKIETPWDERNSAMSLASLLNRSSGHLKCLTLQDMALLANMLVSILTQLPVLVELTVNQLRPERGDNLLTRELIEGLTSTSEQFTLVLRLEKLVVVQCNMNSDVKGDLIFYMISSRRGGRSQDELMPALIKKVRLKTFRTDGRPSWIHSDSFSADQKIMLDIWKQEGAVIEIVL